MPLQAVSRAASPREAGIMAQFAAEGNLAPPAYATPLWPYMGGNILERMEA